MTRTGFGTLLCLILCSLVGCSGKGKPGPEPEPESKIKPLLLGSWISSTSPEMAATADTMKFRESGEWENSGVVKFEGRTVTQKVEGKEQVVRATLVGTWELKGDQLRVNPTQSTVTPFRAEPYIYKVMDITQNKLVLHKDMETLTLFRAE